jgi:hypothetical protein
VLFISLRMHLGMVCNSLVIAHTDISTDTITLFIALRSLYFSRYYASFTVSLEKSFYLKNQISKSQIVFLINLGSKSKRFSLCFLNQIPKWTLIKLRPNFSNKMKQPHFYFILLYLEVSQPFSKSFSKSN